MKSVLSSKPCLKRPLKKKTKIGFQYRLYRLMQVKSFAEHSAILSSSIKLSLAVKIFVLSFLSGRLRHVLLCFFLSFYSHRVTSKSSNISKCSNVTTGGETTMYKDEFYILWNTGITDEDVPMATAAVCSITIDDGDAILIHVFNSAEDEVEKAEDKLLDWISDDPYVNSGAKLDIEIFMNHSPLATFSAAFAQLLRSFENREKLVRVEIKLVRISNVDSDDPDADENRFGLQELHSMGVELNPVTGKDWQYLREILREMDGLRRQEKQSIITRKKIAEILKQGEEGSIEGELGDEVPYGE